MLDYNRLLVLGKRQLAITCIITRGQVTFQGGNKLSSALNKMSLYRSYSLANKFDEQF